MNLKNMFGSSDPVTPAIFILTPDEARRIMGEYRESVTKFVNDAEAMFDDPTLSEKHKGILRKYLVEERAKLARHAEMAAAIGPDAVDCTYDEYVAFRVKFSTYKNNSVAILKKKIIEHTPEFSSEEDED